MKRLYSEKAFEILRVLTSMLIALGLAVVMITFVSAQPWAAVGYFLAGPLDSPAHIGHRIDFLKPFLRIQKYHSPLKCPPFSNSPLKTAKSHIPNRVLLSESQVQDPP